MSGLEAAGLALGAVPIIVLAAQAYSTLGDLLDKLRRRDKAAERLWLRFRMLRMRLCNDLRLFLQPISKNRDPWLLFQNNELSDVQQREFSEYMRSTLGDERSDLVVNVFRQIVTILDEVHKSLANAEELALAEPMARSKKTKLTMDTLVNEKRYEGQLDRLKMWIGEFSDLLAIHKAAASSDQPGLAIGPLPLPSSILAVNKASKDLFISLESSWTCLNGSHGGHEASMCFDADLDMDDIVNMDISIFSRPKTSDETTQVVPSPSVTSRLWLHVKSTPAACETDQCRTVKRFKLRVEGDRLFLPERSKKMKTEKRGRNEIDVSIDNYQGQGFNVKKIPSFCCHLNVIATRAALDAATLCAERLKATRDYRHELFPTSATASAGRSKSISIKERLGQMAILEQLKIAQRITIGLLKFSHTPWLGNKWCLEDIFYTPLTDRVPQSPTVADSIHTSRLHFSRLIQKESIELTKNETFREFRFLMGIDDIPLLYLGIALLEIAHRKPLSEMRLNGDADDVVTARRILKSHDTGFGERYRRIVHHCLYSTSYVEDSELGEGKLKTAVYNNVALELENMAKEIEKTLRIS